MLWCCLQRLGNTQQVFSFCTRQLDAQPSKHVTAAKNTQRKATTHICLTVLKCVWLPLCVHVAPPRVFVSYLLAHPIEPVTFQSCTCTDGAFTRRLGAPVFRAPHAACSRVPGIEQQTFRFLDDHSAVWDRALCVSVSMSVCVCVCTRAWTPTVVVAHCTAVISGLIHTWDQWCGSSEGGSRLATGPDYFLHSLELNSVYAINRCTHCDPNPAVPLTPAHTCTHTHTQKVVCTYTQAQEHAAGVGDGRQTSTTTSIIVAEVRGEEKDTMAKWGHQVAASENNSTRCNLVILVTL